MRPGKISNNVGSDDGGVGAGFGLLVVVNCGAGAGVNPIDDGLVGPSPSLQAQRRPTTAIIAIATQADFQFFFMYCLLGFGLQN
jgi:hypothetical protein